MWPLLDGASVMSASDAIADDADVVVDAGEFAGIGVVVVFGVVDAMGWPFAIARATRVH